MGLGFSAGEGWVPSRYFAAISCRKEKVDRAWGGSIHPLGFVEAKPLRDGPEY